MADDVKDGGTNDADGGGDKPGEKPQGERTFTQADVDRIVGERATRASEAAVTKLLESLGVKSADDIKAGLLKAKELEDAQLSEQQKALKKIEELTAAKTLAETQAAEVAAKAQTTLMRAAVLSEASKADYNFKPEALADVWTFVDRASIKAGKDGESFEGVAEALKAVAKAKPYLCNEAKPGQGTPRRGPEKQSGKKPEVEPGKGYTL